MGEEFDKTGSILETLTLAGVPLDCCTYRLGNRSALEWVIEMFYDDLDAFLIIPGRSIASLSSWGMSRYA